jgi:DNA-binding transcriptional regulator YbjK
MFSQLLLCQALKRSETEADDLRDRLSDLERRLAQDQRALSSSQKNVDTSKREALELLAVIYLRVAKMTGSDVGAIDRFMHDKSLTPLFFSRKLIPRPHHLQ